MRIAQIAPLIESVPPRLYGGTERIVAYLCDELVSRGHEVTLFASGDSATRAVLVPVRARSLRRDSTELTCPLSAHLSMLATVHDRRAEFDVLHFHVDLLHFPMFADCASRTLTSLHGRLDYSDIRAVYNRWNEYPLVAVSTSQRSQLPSANWAGTVHHGIPLAQYPFNATHGGYLAFLGQMSQEKGPVTAISIAQRLKMPIRLAAKVSRNTTYFREQVAPLLREPSVCFLGEIDDLIKGEFLGNAEVLLFPIAWPEPFGITMIEAMACGTPVVAFGCGSAREVIDDGVTGFVVDTEQEAVEAVDAARRLSRQEVRRCFERRFSAQSMGLAYSGIYAKLLAAL